MTSVGDRHEEDPAFTNAMVAKWAIKAASRLQALDIPNERQQLTELGLGDSELRRASVRFTR